MSFGLGDWWIDPDDPAPLKCRDCSEWEACPCGCGWGWCRDLSEYTEGKEECDR